MPQNTNPIFILEPTTVLVTVTAATTDRSATVTGETRTGTVIELLGDKGFKVKTETGNAFIKKEDVI